MGPTTTSPTSAASLPASKRQAFTLTELMIAIVVIVILAGILLPVLVKAHRSGRLTRLQADLQAVSGALETYRTDFGDYPRLQPPTAAYPPPPSATSYGTNIGAATLGKAIMGPYGDGKLPGGVDDPADPPIYNPSIPYHPGDCVKSGTDLYVCIWDIPQGETFTSQHWAHFDPHDGNDNWGFRTQLTIDSNGDGVPDTAGGKVWGPYLQPDLLKVQGSALLDHEGHPILYFPTRPGKHNLKEVASPVDPANGVYCAANDGSYIDAWNNLEAFRHANATPPEPYTFPIPAPMAVARIRMMMGDLDGNGYMTTTISAPGLNLNETPADKPYILWSAGIDGFYGPNDKSLPTAYPVTDLDKLNDVRQAVENCDDVTNLK